MRAVCFIGHTAALTTLTLAGEAQAAPTFLMDINGGGEVSFPPLVRLCDKRTASAAATAAVDTSTWGVVAGMGRQKEDLVSVTQHSSSQDCSSHNTLEQSLLGVVQLLGEVKRAPGHGNVGHATPTSERREEKRQTPTGRGEEGEQEEGGGEGRGEKGPSLPALSHQDRRTAFGYMSYPLPEAIPGPPHTSTSLACFEAVSRATGLCVLLRDASEVAAKLREQKFTQVLLLGEVLEIMKQFLSDQPALLAMLKAVAQDQPERNQSLTLLVCLEEYTRSLCSLLLPMAQQQEVINLDRDIKNTIGNITSFVSSFAVSSAQGVINQYRCVMFSDLAQEDWGSHNSFRRGRVVSYGPFYLALRLRDDIRHALQAVSTAYSEGVGLYISELQVGALRAVEEAFCLPSGLQPSRTRHSQLSTDLKFFICAVASMTTENSINPREQYSCDLTTPEATREAASSCPHSSSPLLLPVLSVLGKLLVSLFFIHSPADAVLQPLHAAMATAASAASASSAEQSQEVIIDTSSASMSSLVAFLTAAPLPCLAGDSMCGPIRDFTLLTGTPEPLEVSQGPGQTPLPAVLALADMHVSEGLLCELRVSVTPHWMAETLRLRYELIGDELGGYPALTQEQISARRQIMQAILLLEADGRSWSSIAFG